MPDPHLQTCPRCGKGWPPDGFAPANRGKLGTYCRSCNREYQAAWQAARRPEPKRCSHEGCNVVITRNLIFCAEHRPAAERPWKTFPASSVHAKYSTMHNRVRQVRGPASEHPCIDNCGKSADAWSYDHADPFEVSEDRHGLALTYSLSTAHYQPRCNSCHTFFDRGAESWGNCMAPDCTRGTAYSYCYRHPVGPLRFGPGKGMVLGYRQAPLDEHGRKRPPRHRLAVASTMTEKRCNDCRKTLPVESFSIIRSRADNPDRDPYRSYCIPCEQARGLAKYRKRTSDGV